MGQVTHAAIHLRAIRQREFRRMVVLSAVAHIGMVFLAIAKPSPPAAFLPGVVSVELVAAPPSPPRATPAPAPAAAPPAPVPEKVVLPAQPAAPKPAPKVVPQPVQKVPAPRPEPVERDYSDVLEQLRADAGEFAPEPVAPAPEPAPVLAGQFAADSGGAVGRPVSPEVALWVKKAKIHVRRAWVLPPAFRTQALEAHVLVDLDASGNVIGLPEVVRKSGNPWFDEGVVRAIQKASPLPPPPSADEWQFVFVPGDSY